MEEIQHLFTESVALSGKGGIQLFQLWNQFCQKVSANTQEESSETRIEGIDRHLQIFFLKHLLLQEKQGLIQVILQEGEEKKPTTFASFSSSIEPNAEEILSKIGSEEDSKKIVIIANEHIRHLALGYNEAEHKLSKMQLDILEEIGKFKDNGLTQNILCKDFKLESKYIFHHLRILETYGLITKKPVFLNANAKTKISTNILHLKRFSAQYNFSLFDVFLGGPMKYQSKDNMEIIDIDKAIIDITSRLQNAPDMILPHSVIKDEMAHHGIKSKKGFRKFVRKLSDAGILEEIIVETDQQNYKCVRLIREYIPGSITNLSVKENAPLKPESDGEMEPEVTPQVPLQADVNHTELVNELHIDHQIFNMIRDSKEFGITQTDIWKRTALPRKASGNKCAKLIKEFGVISVEENLGKNKTYRLITPEYEQEFRTRFSKLKTPNKEEISESGEAIKKITSKKKPEGDSEAKNKSSGKKKELPRVDLTTGETPKNTPIKPKKSKISTPIALPQEPISDADVTMKENPAIEEVEKSKKRQRKSDENSKKTKRVKAVDKSALQIHLDSIDVDSPPPDTKKTRVIVTSVSKLKEKQKQVKPKELSDLPIQIDQIFNTYSIEKVSNGDLITSLKNSPIKLTHPVLAECIKSIMRVPLSEYNPEIAKKALENFTETEITDCFYELKKMNVIVKVKGQPNAVGLRRYKLSSRYQQALNCPLGDHLYDEANVLWKELKYSDGSAIQETRSTYAIESGGRVAVALALLAHGMKGEDGKIQVTEYPKYSNSSSNFHQGGTLVLQDFGIEMKPVKELLPVISPFSEKHFSGSEKQDESIDIDSLITKLKLRENQASHLRKIYEIIESTKSNGISQQTLVGLTKDIKENDLEYYLKLLVDHKLIATLNGFNEHHFYSTNHIKRFQNNQNSDTKEIISIPQNKITTFNQLEKTGNIVGNPWVKYNGEADIQFINSLRRKILTMVMLNPGISEETLVTMLSSALMPSCTKDVLSLLEDEKLIYSQLIPTEVVSLFSNGEKKLNKYYFCNSGFISIP